MRARSFFLSMEKTKKTSAEAKVLQDISNVKQVSTKLNVSEDDISIDLQDSQWDASEDMELNNFLEEISEEVAKWMDKNGKLIIQTWLADNQAIQKCIGSGIQKTTRFQSIPTSNKKGLQFIAADQTPFVSPFFSGEVPSGFMKQSENPSERTYYFSEKPFSSAFKPTEVVEIEEKISKPIKKKRKVK